MSLRGFSLMLSSVLLLGTVSGQVQWHGFIDSYHAWQVGGEQDWLSSRSRLRLEPSLYGDGYALKGVFNFEYNDVLDDADPASVRELFIDLFKDDWDMRIGRQILIWGKTEGLQVLDAVSPWDLREFLARDFEDLRIGVDAMRIRYLQDDWTVEAVYLPRFQPAIRAERDSPWYIETGSGLGGGQPVPERPPLTPENGELGLRISKYSSWGDLSFVALRTWSDQPMPELRPGEAGEGPLIVPEYQRLNIYGLGVSVPLGACVLRGEAALYDGYDLLANGSALQMSTSHVQLKWVIGLDWTPGDTWVLSVQVTDAQLLDYDEAILMPEHERMATLSVEKQFFRETLKCGLFSFIGLDHHDTFNRLSLDYSLTDAFHLFAGFDLFTGSAGLLGSFDENDELWFKLKYSF